MINNVQFKGVTTGASTPCVNGNMLVSDTIGDVTTPPGLWPPPRTRSTWPPVALAAIALVLAATALIVAITRSTTASPVVAAPTTTYSADDTTAAHLSLCDVYSRAAHAVQVESSGGGTALARIATVNGAVMLEAAAAVPAVGRSDRTAALALSAAYRDLTAVGSVASASDAAWRSAVDDVNVRDAAMKEVCGG